MGTTTGMNGSAGQWYQVESVSAACLGGTADRDYASVLPAALHAARYRRPFIAGWLSRGGGAPLELITNSGPLPLAPVAQDPEGQQAAADAEPQREELLFPLGARGTAIERNMVDDLDHLVWVACPGRRVPLADAETAFSPDREAATPFESALLTLMGRPFAWLIVADPADLLDSEMADLRGQVSMLRRYDEEQSRFDADRAQRRLAELDAYREAGLWNVRVLVGAASEQDVRLIAPLLVGSADLSSHPYRLRCADSAQEFADVLAARTADDTDGSMVPFTATAGVLAALTGLPRCEVPGVRVVQASHFDLTSEVGGEDAIGLGEILDGQDRPVGTLRIPLTTLNRHALVTGATGSGKSQTVRHLLEQLSAGGVGWLAIEPVKSEYATMAARLGGAAVTLVNPADPEAVPLSVSPLAPEPGFSVQAHIDMVRALVLAAFDAQEPFPQIIAQALERVYADCGWDPVAAPGSGPEGPPAVPTIAQLQAAALEVIKDVGYGPELQADVRGFVDVRLRSLRTGTAGRFFEGGHPVDVGELLSRNVVLALEDVANDEDKAFVIGTLLIRIVEHLRLRGHRDDGEQLRHVIVLEEAHRLLRAGRDGAGRHAVELFATMLAEIRAYGVGIVIAEQIPSKLVPDVVKNTALKVVHRLPASDDRQLVGAAMNLDDSQSRQVVSMRPGEAAVFADGMDRPVRVRVPYGGARERAAAQPAAGQIPLTGRRSPSCGPVCRSERACTLVELRAAERLATSPPDAWLRVWAEACVLAYLTNRPRPRVPVPLRERWATVDRRLRECLLAAALDRSLRSREQALRPSFDPVELAAACAEHAASMLDGGKGAGTRPGPEWVIPPVQWLHEMERLCPLNAPPPDPFALAPPLDYALPGLSDRAGVKVGQRVSGLRRHPLSMELGRNRLRAWTVLLGTDDQAGFIEDLAEVAIGVSHTGQLRKAAGEMGVTGWLEAVLSWPRRFIVGTDDLAGTATAPEPEPVSG